MTRGFVALCAALVAAAATLAWGGFQLLALPTHGSRVAESIEGGQVPRQEIVAEVVAAVLCKLLDLDGYLPHSREYVEHYSGGGGPARAAMKVLGDVQAVLLLILEGEHGETASWAAEGGEA